jgi:hypothetical protein
MRLGLTLSGHGVCRFLDDDDDDDGVASISKSRFIFHERVILALHLAHHRSYGIIVHKNSGRSQMELRIAVHDGDLATVAFTRATENDPSLARLPFRWPDPPYRLR